MCEDPHLHGFSHLTAGKFLKESAVNNKQINKTNSTFIRKTLILLLDVKILSFICS